MGLHVPSPSRLEGGVWIKSSGWRGGSCGPSLVLTSPYPTQLWDLTAGKMMSEFPGHAGPVNVVEFHPNEYLLASGSSDR